MHVGIFLCITYTSVLVSACAHECLFLHVHMNTHAYSDLRPLRVCVRVVQVLNSYEMDCPAICCRNELRNDDAGESCCRRVSKNKNPSPR
jgi:hypothetical protein